MESKDINYGHAAHQEHLRKRLAKADKKGVALVEYDHDVYMKVHGKWVPWWAYKPGGAK